MIDPSIPLNVRQIQPLSPMDAIQRSIAIADMVAGMQERQQVAKQRKEEAPLRTARIDKEKRELADVSMLDSVLDKHWKLNDAGDTIMDDAAAKRELPGHLHPIYDAQKTAFLKSKRQGILDEYSTQKQVIDNLGSAADSFLDLDDEQRAAQYPAFLETVRGVNPALAQSFPPQYDPTNAASKVQDLSYEAFRVKDATSKVKWHQDRDDLRVFKMTPQQIWKEDHPEDADSEAPEWWVNAIEARKRGLKEPPVSMYKPTRIGTLTGDNLPADATDDQGNSIAADLRRAEVSFDRFRDPATGKSYYQAGKTAAKTSREKEHERVERAYAVAVGKKYEDLDDRDRVAADAWYKKLTPAKATEFDKRLALYSRDPETYAALYGHGADDKPLTQAQKATIINRINADISKQGLTGETAANYRASRVKELKEAGIEISVAAATPTAKPQPGGMVVVELKNGKRGNIPAANVDKFLKENPGSKRVKS